MWWKKLATEKLEGPFGKNNWTPKIAILDVSYDETEMDRSLSHPLLWKERKTMTKTRRKLKKN